MPFHDTTGYDLQQDTSADYKQGYGIAAFVASKPYLQFDQTGIFMYVCIWSYYEIKNKIKINKYNFPFHMRTCFNFDAMIGLNIKA